MLAKRFSDYEGLADWVREQGYELSEDSLWRYGKSLKEEFTAIRLAVAQARTLAERAPDHKGRMMKALVQVVQQKLLSALVEENSVDHVRLCRLVHAVAHLVRVYMPHQQAAAESRRRKKAQEEYELQQLIDSYPDDVLEGEYDEDSPGDQREREDVSGEADE